MRVRESQNRQKNLRQRNVKWKIHHFIFLLDFPSLEFIFLFTRFYFTLLQLFTHGLAMMGWIHEQLLQQNKMHKSVTTILSYNPQSNQYKNTHLRPQIYLCSFPCNYWIVNLLANVCKLFENDHTCII